MDQIQGDLVVSLLLRFYTSSYWSQTGMGKRYIGYDTGTIYERDEKSWLL
jgi:hypothetical protein